MIAAILLATLVVAFLAGAFALAMPCCFTVLLPSYLAKSFATPAGRLSMTAVFSAGLATVLLPIAMGATFLSAFITLNHPVLFVVGGFFMIILGLLTLWGVSMLPRFRAPVDLGRRDVPSVYALGVFGGVASSCCAPVLAGVLVLTVLAGNWFAALGVGLAYIAGMVFPLLVVALAWDRRTGPTSPRLRGRMVSLRWLGFDTEIHSSKLIAGTLFVSMGVFTIVLGVLDRMLLNPVSSGFGIYQTSLERALVTLFSSPIGAAVFASAAVTTVVATIRFTRRRRPLAPDGDLPSKSPEGLRGHWRTELPEESDT